ncbi:hypothetical protein C0992_000339 [Termitomyces sp. T32_za158]|nr:hypothetical protein C0992_000339 [Termitomyces sp. T32_za158]
MDEVQSLDALAKLLNDLTERPYDINLHIQHFQLAKSLEGMESQIASACEMLVDFLAAGEQVWSILIAAKEKVVDLETKEGVEELLTLYSRAEADYLSIPILERHLRFLIDRHAYYSGEILKPAALGDLFSTAWTRTAIAEVVKKGIGHLTQSHLLWDLQRDWELQQLESIEPIEKNHLQDIIQVFFMTRLAQPHSSKTPYLNYRHIFVAHILTDSEETLQYYSTFTTNNRSSAQYEPLLVTASKARSHALKSLERRETFENALVRTKYSLDDYARYIVYERRARNPDLLVMVTVFERAIAEAEKRRFNGEVGAEEALRMFWIGLADALRINAAGEENELAVFQRAIRSVPGCGEIWARYMRAVERHGSGEQVAEIFNQAFGMGLVQSDAEQIIPVVLAHAGYLRRRMKGETDVDPLRSAVIEEILPTLIGILESGIDMVRKGAFLFVPTPFFWRVILNIASKTGDSKLRLEKYLAAIYQQAELDDNVISVWEAAAKCNKSSYLVWLLLTETLIKYQQVDKAAKVFLDIHTKKLDWPEAIWEAWINFEQLYGSIDELDQCLDKVEQAQYQVNLRRAKEAEKAGYQAYQAAIEAEPTTKEETTVHVETDVSMDVDADFGPRGGTKRQAEDEPVAAHKKAKMGRDRENSTVFVGNLPAGITEEELTGLFKDCGSIREVKITQMPETLVATVEFFDRDSVLAALTKDKKKLRDQEVAVHLAWKSTLYVTNFPESADDSVIRDLFGQYGTLFDVRWPSKKYKSTRRFCYVQFTSPTSAQNALELHGRELEPNHPMNVFLSNPERKKERTDQDANDREIYVAGLSKFTTQADLDKLFKTYGVIKEIRMTTDDKGHSKGFAFIEYEQEKDALASLDANNYELKKRRIAVTLADSRVRSRTRNAATDSGLGRIEDTRNRSVRIRNLPENTQDGLLQQVFEKITTVKRIEVFIDQNEAVVELENAAEAGKLLLRTDPIIYNGKTLQLSEERRDGAAARPNAPPSKTGGLFVPRAAASRPRAGLGHARKPAPASKVVVPSAPADQAASSSNQGRQGKGQDDFRKMLGGQ